MTLIPMYYLRIQCLHAHAYIFDTCTRIHMYMCAHARVCITIIISMLAEKNLRAFQVEVPLKSAKNDNIFWLVEYTAVLNRHISEIEHCLADSKSDVSHLRRVAKTMTTVIFLYCQHTQSCCTTRPINLWPSPHSSHPPSRSQRRRRRRRCCPSATASAPVRTE